MLSRYSVAVGSLATLLCLHCPAQSTPQPSSAAQAPTASTDAAQTQPATPATPAQTPSASAPLRLQDLPPDPHTPTPAEVEQQHQQQALAAAAQLAGAEARWGPEISTPGISVALVEVNRTKTPDGTTQIDYQITASGFTPGEKLSLIRWPLDGSAKSVMSGIALDAKGVAICAAPSSAASAAQPVSPAAANSSAPAAGASQPPAAPSCTTTMQPNQPVQIQTTAAPGEAIRIALLGAGRNRGAATSVVPFPIANQDKGCKLQVILGVKNADLVLVEGTGFPANTALKLETVTAGQPRAINTKTDADGRLVVAVLPAQKGQDSGDTTVRYAGVVPAPTLQTSAPAQPDPGCAPSVTFHWGKGSYQAQ